MASIAAIGTALAKYEVSIPEIFTFMQAYCGWNDTEKHTYKMLYDRSGIEKKYSVLPDFNFETKQKTIFNAGNIVSTQQRLEIFKTEALAMALQCVYNGLGKTYNYSKITHIITVSCTGFWAPGLDIILMQSLGIAKDTERTSVNFMGCYASIHALKMAKYICNSQNKAQVLIVSVELCTLHLQRKNTMDNVAANLLFGDGAACVLVNNDGNFINIKEFYSEIDHSAANLMQWDIAQEGFEMILGKEIPNAIEKNAASLVANALLKNKLSKNDIKTYAIHPGGRKIVDIFQHKLQISEISLQSSYRILKNYGNMSSATILYVLKDILENKIEAKAPIFVAAFGPGLCMETVVLDY